MTLDTNRVVFCVDENIRQREMLDYAIKSIHKFAPTPCHITVVSNKECAESEWVDANKYIERYKVDRIIEGMKYLTGKQISPMCFMRLYIPLMEEFTQDSRILYLDTDVEIIDSDFFSIFKLPINADLGACKEPPQVSKWRQRGLEQCLEALKTLNVYGKRIKDGKIYNSGIMLMNLEGIRRRYNDLPALYETIINILKEQSVRGWDQNVVNLLFDIQEVPSNFNCVSGWRYAGRPLALHYPGRNKLVGEYPPRVERAKILKEAKA